MEGVGVSVGEGVEVVVGEGVGEEGVRGSGVAEGEMLVGEETGVSAVGVPLQAASINTTISAMPIHLVGVI
jgi:hypothetical protein